MTAIRLNIMLFSHICSDTHITGAEKLLLFFATELRGSHTCTLVVPSEGLLAAEARARGISTIVIPYPNFYEVYVPGPYFHQGLVSFIRDNGGAVQSLLALLLEQRPDLVIVNTCVNLMPAWISRSLGIPVGWMMTEQIQSNRYTSSSTEIINAYSDWIIGISHASLQPFRGTPGEGKLRILYPSWNEPELERELWPEYRSGKRTAIGWNDSHRVIGYVSSDIYPNKGLEHFIQMAIDLGGTYPDLRFMVAGKMTDVGYYTKCLEQIRLSGLLGRFYFHSFEMQIQQIYPAMDILVIPSLIEEGFGMTALEGLIFGKTVVTYSSGGLGEIMMLTGNGTYLVDKGNIRGLIETVGSLLAKGDFVQSWGTRNSIAVEKAFGIGSYRLRLADWLQEASNTLPAFGPRPLPQEALLQKPALLLRGSAPAVYLVEYGCRYLFSQESVFLQRGFRFEEVLALDDGYLGRIPMGGVLGTGQPAPQGRSPRHRARRIKAGSRSRQERRGKLKVWKGKGKRLLARKKRSVPAKSRRISPKAAARKIGKTAVSRRSSGYSRRRKIKKSG
ncbi:MAG: extracellular matrix biosynthesis-like protein [Paenibacillaceae bacterium]|jgi:glycosyltransferase involved in cell wall biosynthesis|nr:extracellular matrix biosynthesis-like protein [Paenibacillaceae bacterium]